MFHYVQSFKTKISRNLQLTTKRGKLPYYKVKVTLKPGYSNFLISFGGFKFNILKVYGVLVLENTEGYVRIKGEKF